MVTTHTNPRRIGLALTAVLILLTAGVLLRPGFAHASTAQENIANLAAVNEGKTACGKNSSGGTGFETSCTGYTGHGPAQYWCADFAKWVWAKNGVKGTSVLNAAAYSFYTYAQDHGGVHSTPKIGDVALFSVSKGDHTSDSGGIHHVAVVIGWSDSGKKVHTVSGDWYDNPPSGVSEAYFASHSHVVDNNKGVDYPSAPGDRPSGMTGYYIIGYVSPVV